MEKLIKLLNEYIKEKELWNTVKEIDDDYFVNNNNNWDWYLCEEVMSKKFWFIERLVKQNKIDDSKVWNSDMLSVQYHDLVNDYKYEWLIMILSISENPISDLCSFLK